jgi:hypothetical protein
MPAIWTSLLWYACQGSHVIHLMWMAKGRHGQFQPKSSPFSLNHLSSNLLLLEYRTLRISNQSAKGLPPANKACCLVAEAFSSTGVHYTNVAPALSEEFFVSPSEVTDLLGL